MAEMSEKTEDAIAALNKFASQHQSKYTKAKVVTHTTAAVVGVATTVAVALLWWNPFSWTVGLLGGGVKLVAQHGLVSFGLGVGGLGVGGACGAEASTIDSQQKLMKEGE